MKKGFYEWGYNKNMIRDDSRIKKKSVKHIKTKTKRNKKEPLDLTIFINITTASILLISILFIGYFVISNIIPEMQENISNTEANDTINNISKLIPNIVGFSGNIFPIIMFFMFGMLILWIYRIAC